MTELKREELYTLVWSGPMREVCKELSISDVALRKICVKMDIPVPRQGYWLAKTRSKPMPLPPARTQTRTTYRVRRLPETAKHLASEAVAVASDIPAVIKVP